MNVTKKRKIEFESYINNQFHLIEYVNKNPDKFLNPEEYIERLSHSLSGFKMALHILGYDVSYTKKGMFGPYEIKKV